MAAPAPLERAMSARASARSPAESTPTQDVIVVPDFDQLYEAHFDFVYRCLRRLGVPAAYAEDVTQDTFVVLYKRIADLRPDASPRAFLFAIALRLARASRRERWRTRSEPLAPEMRGPAHEPDPFERASNAQAVQLLERFLSDLDEDQRIAFMLTELEELSAPEISEALTVPVNTVYSRVRLARERFVKFLGAEGQRR